MEGVWPEREGSYGTTRDNGYLGASSILAAELWTLIHGLKLVWTKGVRKLIADIDSLQAYTELRRPMHDCSRYTNLVKECQELLNCDWIVKVQHIYREGNNATDYLPDLSRTLNDTDYKEWRIPPLGLERIVMARI